MARCKSAEKLRRGFSLIELTIALAIFSTGLGGFSLLLMLAMQESAISRFQNLAVMQAASLAQTLRMTSGIPTANPPDPAASNCLQGSICTADEMIAASIHDWKQGLAKQIPGSFGLLCFDSTPYDGSPADPRCDGMGALVIKVLWEEPGSHEENSLRERRVVARLPLL